MSRRTPTQTGDLDNPLGLQYPSDIDSNTPVGAAFKNVFDNLFYLQGQIAKAASADPTLTPQQIALLVQRLINHIGIKNSNVIVGTHANRLTIYGAASGAVGAEYFEYDRTSTYVISNSTGTKRWVYAAGSMSGALATRPTDLGTADAGFMFTDTTTDNETEWLWDGAEWLTIGGYLQEVSDAVTAAITTVQVLRHLTSGAAAAGYGIGQLFQLENANGTTVSASRWSYEWSDATAGTEDATARLFLIVAGALSEALNITSTGLMTLVGNYAWKSGTNFTGTLDHANTAARVYSFPDADGFVPALPTTATTETGTGAVVRANSPTVVTPTIANFTNAQHDHQNAAGGGALDAAAISTGVLTVPRGGRGAGGAVAFAAVPAVPVEGMTVPITDSTTDVWGAVITGGGGLHVLGYYNGTNWTVAAK